MSDTDIELAHRRGWLTRNVEVLIKLKKAFHAGLIDSETYVTLINLLNEDK